MGLMYSADVGHRQGPGELAPPAFLGLVGHAVRWRLLGELAASDRQVHELTALLGQPQNLVSYHLGRLRKANLVTARRSTADGRDNYYSLDLALCGRLLAAAGGALHPALLLAPPTKPLPEPKRCIVYFSMSIKKPVSRLLAVQQPLQSESAHMS